MEEPIKSKFDDYQQITRLRTEEETADGGEKMNGNIRYRKFI